MKLSCTKENLSQALALASGVTGKNISLPILNNVLIRVGEQKVEVVATNLELAVTVNLRAKIEQTGAFTVPARTLMDYVNLLSGERVDLEVKDNELLVVCGKSSTKIKGVSADDYPIIPTMDGGKGYLVNAEKLKNGLGQVLSAAARNDIRPELSGVFFGFCLEGKEGLVLAATDSYRLAEKKIALSQGKDEAKIIVPSRMAAEMIRALGAGESDQKEENARIVGENQLMVSYDNAQVLSRLVEGQYPDYTQIVPKNFNTTAEMNAVEFTKEMKASGLFTTTGVNAVTLDFKATAGVVGVSSLSTQTGEYNSEVGAEITGQDNKVVLNNHYVLDGLNNCSTERVVLQMISGDSPCLLKPKGDDNYLYIVMPIRQ